MVSNHQAQRSRSGAGSGVGEAALDLVHPLPGSDVVNATRGPRPRGLLARGLGEPMVAAPGRWHPCTPYPHGGHRGAAGARARPARRPPSWPGRPAGPVSLPAVWGRAAAAGCAAGSRRGGAASPGAARLRASCRCAPSGRRGWAQQTAAGSWGCHVRLAGLRALCGRPLPHPRGGPARSPAAAAPRAGVGWRQAGLGPLSWQGPSTRRLLWGVPRILLWGLGVGEAGPAPRHRGVLPASVSSV